MLVQHALHLVHHIDLSQGSLLVKGDVTHQERVLAVDHRGTARKLDVSDLSQRYLRAVHGGNQHVVEHVRGIAQLTGIAHPDGEALTPLHRVALAHATDGGREDALHVAHLNAIARQFLSVELNLYIRSTGGTVVIHGGAVDFGDVTHHLLQLQAGLLDRLQVGTVNLQTHRGLQSR